jgi:hypothetical protein
MNNDDHRSHEIFLFRTLLDWLQGFEGKYPDRYKRWAGYAMRKRVNGLYESAESMPIE